MTVNYELQIVNYDEARQDAGEFVRIINYPARDLYHRMEEALAYSEISTCYTYNIYSIDEHRNRILVGQGDYDKDKGSGFYFYKQTKPKEDN